MLQTYEMGVAIGHMFGQFSPSVVNPVASLMIEVNYMSGKMKTNRKSTLYVLSYACDFKITT